jgi:hypothetical protein
MYFVTPQLIPVQYFAFRGRAVSLPGMRLRGLTSTAFPAGVYVLHSNQLLEPVKTIIF